MKRGRWTLLGAVILFAAACGDDAGPTATPEQAEAIATLIDAELSAEQQRCVLQGLIDTGIDPQSVVERTITGEEDAALLGIAVACVEDLTAIPAFVQSFIEGAAAEGTTFTLDEAICAINSLDDPDPTRAIADCVSESAIEGARGYGDDDVLDLLWDACEGGNNQACDELYDSAPLDSDYLEFARTCAGQLLDSVGRRCFVELG